MVNINKLCQNKIIHFQKIYGNCESKRGDSQDRLAKLADIANNTIIKIEQGEKQNPTLDILKKVAEALVVSVYDLIN